MRNIRRTFKLYLTNKQKQTIDFFMRCYVCGYNEVVRIINTNILPQLKKNVEYNKQTDKEEEKLSTLFFSGQEYDTDKVFIPNTIAKTIIKQKKNLDAPSWLYNPIHQAFGNKKKPIRFWNEQTNKPNTFNSKKTGKQKTLTVNNNGIFWSKKDNKHAFKKRKGMSSFVLSGFGKIKFFINKKPRGTPKTATIVKDGNSYNLSVVFSFDHKTPVQTNTKTVGFDLGVTNLYATSEGFLVPGMGKIKQLIRLGIGLKKLQQKLSRQRENAKKNKQPVGKNYYKTSAKFQEKWAKIKRLKKDILEKHSHFLVGEYGKIAIDGVKPSKMTRSAKGSIETPGQNVKQKTGLNRNILNNNWGKFIQLIEQKAIRTGTQTEKINPKNTSITCPKCGSVEKENRKKEKFSCMKCGYANHADVVGAINILMKSSFYTGGLPGSVCRDHELQRNVHNEAEMDISPIPCAERGIFKDQTNLSQISVEVIEKTG